MRIDGLAHGMFVLAVAGFAILSLSYGTFVPIGQAFPAWVPARSFWVYALSDTAPHCQHRSHHAAHGAAECGGHRDLPGGLGPDLRATGRV